LEDDGLNFETIALSKASSSKQTSCLKLGDNLVFHKNFEAARLEYQKIFQSFKQHEEGREALFRQGFSYILEAQKNTKNKKKLFESAIEVFEKFKDQKAKPWEYWGKALTYEAMQQPLEMIKCFEMAFRKYPHHPFTQELRQELLVLFFEKSIKAKKEALMLAFIAIRYLDDALFMNAFPELIESLEEELQESFCLFDPLELTRKQRLILALSFVLKQENFLLESIVKSQDVVYNENAFCTLIHINSKKISQSLIKKLKLDENLGAIFKDEPCPYFKRHLRSAFFAFKLFKLKPVIDIASSDIKENFLIGLNKLLSASLNIDSLQLDSYSKQILELLLKAPKMDQDEIKKALKSAFFQKAEYFIKSNFLISLLDKKPIDYFGFDKYALEFAIKGLFLRKLDH
jgi:tetratricopeptide (TPR) repeat protein